MLSETPYDLFVSHASEDKAGFVRELVERLEALGLRVWLDEAELQIGDTLTKKIDDGLSRSRFGVVVLSRAFFAKSWPRAELDALANREITTGEVVVLPIFLDVAHEEVAAYSPLLGSKLGVPASLGVDVVAEKIERRVRGHVEPEEVRAPAHVALQPEILRGRILPSMYAPIVRGDERALVFRVAYAAAAPTAPEPKFRSEDQDVFEGALDASSLERLLHSMTSPLPRRTEALSWQLVEPTKSWILTASRPAARMIVDGWTIEGRASVTLKPAPSIGPPGWLILVLDAAIRPVDDSDPAVRGKEWTPLSLDEFAELLYVLLATLLDEVGPAIVGRITDSPPLAISCLALPNGDELTRYLRLERYAHRRVDGATGPHAIDWHVTSMADVETPEARFAAIRDRVEELFADGGYRGYESALTQLSVPGGSTGS